MGLSPRDHGEAGRMMKSAIADGASKIIYTTPTVGQLNDDTTTIAVSRRLESMRTRPNDRAKPDTENRSAAREQK